MSTDTYTSEREAVWFAAADAAEMMRATNGSDMPWSVVAYAEDAANEYARDGGIEPPPNGHSISETGPWPPKRMGLYQVRCTCGFSCTVLGRDTRVVFDAHNAHTGHGNSIW